MRLAQEETVRFNHNYVGTEHLLVGLRREEGVAAWALKALGVELDDVRERIETIVGYGEEPSPGHVPFTPRSKKVFELALREAMQLGHNYIGTEHLLLGLVREGEGVTARVLSDLGVSPDRVRGEVLEMLGVEEPSSEHPGEVERPAARPGYEGHGRMRPRPFYRSRYDRLIAGVCGGLAEYFGWDPRLVRVAVAGLVIVTGGAGLAAYLLFWMFVPVEPDWTPR